MLPSFGTILDDHFLVMLQPVNILRPAAMIVDFGFTANQEGLPLDSQSEGLAFYEINFIT